MGGERGRILVHWKRRRIREGGRSRRGGGEGAMGIQLWSGRWKAVFLDEQFHLSGFARLYCCSLGRHSRKPIACEKGDDARKLRSANPRVADWSLEATTNPLPANFAEQWAKERSQN